MVDYFKSEHYAELSNKDLLSWIFDDPPYDQNKPIYVDAVDPSKSISCNQARKMVRKLIAGLRAAGFKKGDCLNVHSFNDIYYSMLFLAVVGAGGVFAGTNPAYTQFELSHHIKTARATFFISEPEILDNLLAATKENNIPASNIWIFNTQGQPLPAGQRSWTELMENGESDWDRFDDFETCKNTTAARLFSSGTTGLPKAAVLSHRNFIAQHTFVADFKAAPHEVSRIIAIPCFHAAAVPATHVSSLKGGQVCYIMRRFDLEEYLKASERFQVSEIITVPPMALGIIKSPLSKHPYLKSATRGTVGAAPLDKDAQAKFRSLLKDGASYTQVWGMTESSCVATMFYWPEHDDTGSIGRPVPCLEMKLIDDDGRNISDYGVRGEICIRGPTVISGYFENPEANAQSFDSDGWFKTGDIGYCDRDTKKWYIVDRKKELIKVRGFQVAPPELEAVVLSHPLVMDAAVIGVGEGDDERPRAYVVRQPVPESKDLTQNQILEFTAPKLAKFKYLSGGVKFVEAIPKNASGKILKRILREDAKKEVQQGLVPKL